PAAPLSSTFSALHTVFFHDPAPTEISTLSLHDALPISGIPIVNVENACASAATALRGAWLEVASGAADVALAVGVEKMNVGDTADRKSTRLNSSHQIISYAVFCLKKKITYTCQPVT